MESFVSLGMTFHFLNDGKFTVFVFFKFFLKESLIENLHDLWIVWEHLWLAYWCWEKSEKYFEEQGFQNNIIAEHSTKTTLFDLYSASREMSAIRE